MRSYLSSGSERTKGLCNQWQTRIMDNGEFEVGGMVSAGRLNSALLKKKFRVSKWDIVSKYDGNVPKKSGVYGLYWGKKGLQYLGSTIDLAQRLSEHRAEKKIPFGHFAWFRLPPSQIGAAEEFLIGRYKPWYNVIGL